MLSVLSGGTIPLIEVYGTLLDTASYEARVQWVYNSFSVSKAKGNVPLMAVFPAKTVSSFRCIVSIVPEILVASSRSHSNWSINR